MIGVIGDRIHTFCEIATLPTKKNFRVEHFGVDLRGESGSPCAPLGPFFFGSAAARRSAPRARPESWPSVGGLTSSVNAHLLHHRLALAQASGQELRAWDSAMRCSRRLERRVARPARLGAHRSIRRSNVRLRRNTLGVEGDRACAMRTRLGENRNFMYAPWKGAWNVWRLNVWTHVQRLLAFPHTATHNACTSTKPPCHHAATQPCHHAILSPHLAASAAAAADAAALCAATAFKAASLALCTSSASRILAPGRRTLRSESWTPFCHGNFFCDLGGQTSRRQGCALGSEGEEQRSPGAGSRWRPSGRGRGLAL